MKLLIASVLTPTRTRTISYYQGENPDDSFLKRFEYDSHYLPDDKHRTKHVWTYNRADFLVLIDHWNSIGADLWHYSAKSN